MYTTIHRLVVLSILVAGVLLARFFPANKSVGSVSEEAKPLVELAPVIAPEDQKTYSVRTPVTPVATPELAGKFHDRTAEPRTPPSRTQQNSAPRMLNDSQSPPPRQRGTRMLPGIAREGQREAANERPNSQTVRRLPSIEQEQRRRRRRGRLTTHRIADGDDLQRLAGKYLLDESRFMEIFELNRQILLSPDLLPVGNEIQVYDERE